jgi:hypothetical protein
MAFKKLHARANEACTNAAKITEQVNATAMRSQALINRKPREFF